MHPNTLEFLCRILLILSTVIVREVAPFWAYICFVLILTWLVFIPWSIASLMSVNKAMIPRIAATVDTWIKMLYMCLAMTYSTIYNIKTSDAPIALLIVFGVSININLCMCTSPKTSASMPIHTFYFALEQASSPGLCARWMLFMDGAESRGFSW